MKRSPKKQLCPFCGAHNLQIVEKNHRQEAYNASQVYLKCYSPDWERIDESSVTFQAICGGDTGTSTGCGFMGPRFTYMMGPRGVMDFGREYCKSAAIAKKKATDAYKSASFHQESPKKELEQTIGYLRDVWNMATQEFKSDAEFRVEVQELLESLVGGSHETE